MIFRRTIFTAIFVGLIAGLILSAIQVYSVNPIIYAAETYEIPESHDHEHSDEAWAPADGAERTQFTIISNISAGIGFAAVLLALMSQLQLQGLTQLSPVKGLIWGLSGFVAFFVAPGLGLPPEIPGIEAEPIAFRQAWWLFTVLAVMLGLLVLAFAPRWYKVRGVVALVVPYLLPIPHHAGAAFNHPDAEALAHLNRLHQEFIVASGAANLLFWLSLGLVSAWALNRWILTAHANQQSDYANG